jgi:uncharacterized LabA/DUF88 family protein
VPERVIAYVDGFNLYFGLKEQGWKKQYWLDVGLLARGLLKSGQQLVGVNYFTARISGTRAKRARQNAYLEALKEMGSCAMHFGVYQHNSRECRRCKLVDNVPSEKMTDVNIAVSMMTDAFENNFDTALLISADSDLTPPVRKIRELRPSKRVIVALPPGRSSKQLTSAASGFIRVDRAALNRSLLPEKIQKSTGYVIERPQRWQ